MNSFFISQFNYCPLVWMCHSRLMNNKINRLHEKCLRIVYSDKTSSFKELLDKDGSVTIQARNLQVLATEMFKIYRNLSPNVVDEIFCVRRNNYNLRHISFISHFFLVPNILEELDDVNSFKTQIKKYTVFFNKNSINQT